MTGLYRTALSAAVLLLCLGNGVPDKPPPPLELDAAAEELLANGEVHVTQEVWDTGGMTVGVIDVRATPEQTMAAVMDLPARVEDIGSLKSVDVYLQTASPERVGAEWLLTVFGTNIIFSVLYDVDREAGWCRYSMDKSRENGIESTEGSYQTYAHNGGTRLVYRGFSESGRYVPGFIKRWLAGSALVDQMQGMKRRAEESAGTP